MFTKTPSNDCDDEEEQLSLTVSEVLDLEFAGLLDEDLGHSVGTLNGAGELQALVLDALLKTAKK